ncbi:hypothetical protein D3C76_1424230 [compost metagenome]
MGFTNSPIKFYLKFSLDLEVYFKVYSFFIKKYWRLNNENFRMDFSNHDSYWRSGHVGGSQASDSGGHYVVGTGAGYPFAWGN